ncbi:DUF6374 family protein [Nocardia wallacei]|uniref:DUF6374 family protein n=1 Tax=Nocardia wallacei TaxID=480035 RepID=UPI00245817D6|nr:DUF6374 family protein [Nocardia wallacei]
MPARPTAEFARQQIDQVRRQLLDAAAFGKQITPDQLEQLASKLATGVQALDAPAEPGPNVRLVTHAGGRLR